MDGRGGGVMVGALPKALVRFRAWDLGFKVLGLGLCVRRRVWVFGLGVLGLGFGVLAQGLAIGFVVPGISSDRLLA